MGEEFYFTAGNCICKVEVVLFYTHQSFLQGYFNADLDKHSLYYKTQPHRSKHGAE